MRVVDIIGKKRDGYALSREEIDQVVAGAVDSSIADYQLAALLMAIVLRGMDEQETAWLTDAMARSGERLDLTAIPGPKVDKHSTGGVGDKTSLILAPLAAACGLLVPMMSGRGLGHTGGTLDKLESIPGFSVTLDEERLREGLRRVGCLITGQTAALAPADRKLYALRDVTGTVESLPLITASIMSKKIAEGIEGLVLDVKVGRGAFMKTVEDARALARAMVAAGRQAGVRTEALLTSMDAPLGRTVGNALEVVESVETLRGCGPRDLEDLSVRLTAQMLVVGAVASSVADGEARARRALESGAGLEKLREMIVFQGGDPRVVDDTTALPVGPLREPVTAPRTGVVAAIDAEAIGRATVLLGAGRDTAWMPVDHAVGARLLRKAGDPVAAGEPLIELYYRTEERLSQARRLATEAFVIGDEAPATPALVLEVIR